VSASQHSLPSAPRGPDVLGELLHSLSQPLTGLLCSLELSLQLSLDLSTEQVAEQQQANVSAALQQTEKVIGMIQLMREYLDAEQPAPEAFSSALAPATRSVTEGLSSIAAVRDVRLRLVGTCTATVPVPESRLRLALQYLIAAMIEAQPPGGKVMLLLGEGPAGAVLRGEGERGFCLQKHSVTSLQTTLRGVRIAIASRVFESAGASLVFGGGDVEPTGFVLRIPCGVAAPAR
jgi:signal transduction histidine kinase